MRPRRSLALAATALGVLLVWSAGCNATATYQGERRPREEVAVVAGTSLLGALHPGVVARVEAIDGVPVEGSPSRVEILPGTHELVLLCRWSGREERIPATVTLEAGGSYVIAVGFDGEGGLDAMVIADER